ncbi:hypothetical protein LWI28_024032 [Acer negundo]|uniref:Uncharacterized protein n=1 Tax=Acer negundo TaxID=4023 RepID=A0AAD5NMC4_ACENE|nr:hypothetical protein LWI28_024032 [Acer negundo]
MGNTKSSTVGHHPSAVRIIVLSFKEGVNMNEVERYIRNSRFGRYILSLTIDQQKQTVTVRGRIDSVALTDGLRKKFKFAKLDSVEDEE